MAWTDGIWDRRGNGDMSRQQFMLLTGLFTFIGLAITAVTCNMTTNWVVFDSQLEKYVYAGPINYFTLWFITLVLGLIGVTVAMKSDKPLFSFGGYMMLAIPYGFLMGPLVGLYTGESVLKAVILTVVVSGVLALVGVVIPENLESWAFFLFSGLLVLLIGQVGLVTLIWIFPGLPVDGAMNVLDWLGLLIFSGYIIFDTNRARFVEPTLDNAIDCALALFIDIIYVFIWFLSKTGQKKS